LKGISRWLSVMDVFLAPHEAAQDTGVGVGIQPRV
jgi:hypothetical protein